MSSQEHKQALPAGFRLRTYRVLRVLGAGGFGVTYLCEHGGLGVQVAVKEYLPNEIAVRDGTAVHPKSSGDRESFEWGLGRFLDEARTLARFEHPSVVRVRDCFEANNTAYIVMDYEDGEPLDALLERHRTLTEAQLKRVVLPVADGLRQVHGAGFLHRDVKPANIFVRRSDESPVLLDFGSARQALGRKSRSMTAIASTGYSPPEQYESQGDQGPWTDIYALSALCHRAITGEAPVEAPRRIGEVARSRADPQRSLAASGVAGYSPGLLEAVDCGLRLIETERPQSLDEWLSGLESATTPRPSRHSEPMQASPPAAQATPLDDAALAAIRHTAHLRRIQPGTAALPNRRGGRTMWGVLISVAVVLAIVLGVMYTKGEDAVEAARSYRKAAEQGHAWAQYNLGVLYETGDGVPKDAVEAARSYRMAAEQGHALAQNNLGILYETGDGVAKDAVEAARWYRKAEEQGEALAQYNLGRLHATGEGVVKDYSEAARWYRKAAEQGHAGAQNHLGWLYATGEGVPKDASKAARWYRKAAEQGLAHAQTNLGWLYATGEGVPKDYSEAARWYHKAAEQGSAQAQHNLGSLHANGQGTPTDNIRAYAWFNLAAAQGHEKAAEARANVERDMMSHQISEAQQLSRELVD